MQICKIYTPITKLKPKVYKFMLAKVLLNWLESLSAAILARGYTLWCSGVQGKNNTYHNVNKVQNQGIYDWIFNLINIVVCVVLALYSSIVDEEDRKLLEN
jgi:hypothetical protein